jgi:hypothetical protein
MPSFNQCALLAIIILAGLVVTRPVLAEVNGKKLGELLGIGKSVPLPPEYVGGCILATMGASTEYWHVAKSKNCSNKIESGFRNEKKYERFIQEGNGFKIFTVCTSMGTAVHCENKPQNTPFDYAPVNYVGGCIRPVKRVSGYSAVFCIDGLPKKQTDMLLRSLQK